MPKANFGTPEWDAESKALEAARESSKVYQLTFWPDDKHAMPGDFIGCALFSSWLQGMGAMKLELKPEIETASPHPGARARPLARRLRC